MSELKEYVAEKQREFDESDRSANHLRELSWELVRKIYSYYLGPAGFSDLCDLHKRVLKAYEARLHDDAENLDAALAAFADYHKRGGTTLEQLKAEMRVKEKLPAQINRQMAQEGE